MPDSEMVDATVLEREQIFDVVRRERYFRDRGRFDEQLECFADPSTVRLTWFNGSGRDFCRQSGVQMQKGSIGRHFTSPMWCEQRGDRALAESDVQMHIRGPLDGVEVDIVNDTRMLERLVRDDGAWKIEAMDFVYFKDRVDPVFAHEALTLDWDAIRAGRPSYRCLNHLLSADGWDIDQELAGVDRPDLVEALYAANAAWLAGAD